MLRIGLFQLNFVVGDLEGNLRRVLDGLAFAAEAGADLAAFPELAICGYPPEDLLGKPQFIADCRSSLEKVAAATARCAAVVGLPLLEEESGAVYNAAAICAEGDIIGFVRKAHLPNYGVFDERRYFAPGRPDSLFTVGGVSLGVSICEDLWVDGGAVNKLAEAGAELILNINASPYCQGKASERFDLLRRRAGEIDRPIAYLNLVGGQDELVFDGNSLVVDASGKTVAKAASFAEQSLVADVEVAKRPPAEGNADLGVRRHCVSETQAVARRPLSGSALPVDTDRLAEVYAALVLGTRDYVRKNGFSRACLGASGGVDSSLVATVAADALGPENVCCVLMPSRFSSGHSVEDAEELCSNLGVDSRLIPIEPAHAAFGKMLAPGFGDLPPDTTEENIQSRIRAVILMALANKFGWLVLATGNKTESAVGYSTLYGDSAGAFAPIKDVWKMQVYELARYRNALAGFSLIPAGVLVKEPSAELRPDQIDSQSLPPYEMLDPLARALVEDDKTPAELIASGADDVLVLRLAQMVDYAEYKRRQSPPGVRVTAKAFGKDRRMPITSHYRGSVQ